MNGIKSKTLTYDTTLLDINSDAYQTLSAYDNKKLIDVIKHYRAYDYGIEYKNSSLALLNARGITEQELKIGGNLADHSYEESIRLKYLYEENSKLALILYSIALLIGVPGAILNNNGFPTTGTVMFYFGCFLYVLFIFALIKSFIDHSNLYKKLDKHNISNALIFALVGLPLYFLFYAYQKKKIKEDLKVTAIKKVDDTAASSEIIDLPLFHKILKDYNAYNRFTLIFYVAALVLLTLYFVFNNNELPAAASASFELGMSSVVIFVIYAVVSAIKFGKLQEQVKNQNSRINILWSLLGLVVYPLVNSLRRKKINRDLSAS